MPATVACPGLSPGTMAAVSRSMFAAAGEAVAPPRSVAATLELPGATWLGSSVPDSAGRDPAALPRADPSTSPATRPGVLLGLGLRPFTGAEAGRAPTSASRALLAWLGAWLPPTTCCSAGRPAGNRPTDRREAGRTPT